MNYLLKALISMILLSISYSELREEVIDRHENGQRKTVMKFLGEGNDEIMVEKLIYSSKGDTLHWVTHSAGDRISKSYIWDDCSLYSEKRFRDDKLYKWYKYHQNGNIAYDADSIDYEYASDYSSYSNELNYLEYRDGHNGRIAVYDENGNLEYKGAIKNGLQNGKWSYYYEGSNQIRKIREYSLAFDIPQVGKDYPGAFEVGDYIDYYKNGNIEIKGSYEILQKIFSRTYIAKNFSSKVGQWTSYYENGQIERQENFEKNYSVGPFVEYYSDGQVKAIGEHQVGMKKSYRYESGHLEIDEQEESHLKTGEWILYYENGQIKEKGEYKNDDKIGEWTSYHENGQIETYGKYKLLLMKEDYGDNSMMTSRKVETWTSYHENGQINKDIKYSNDGKFSSSRSYDQNGRIVQQKDLYTVKKIEYSSDEGRLEIIKDNCIKYGTWSWNNDCPYIEKRYYPNGNVKSERSFHKEKYDWHGKSTSYYPNGQISESGNYNQSSKDSTWTYYYENGQIEELGSYKLGLKNGVWTSYYENGKIESIGRYLLKEDYNVRPEIRNSFKNGIWKYYYPSGQMKEQEEYAVSYYFTTDGYRRRIKEDRSIKKGTWMSYYENGQVKEEKNYSLKTVYEDSSTRSYYVTIKNGDWIGYYLNGEIEYKGKFLDDIEDGKWMYYHENGKKKKKMVYKNGALVKEKEY